MGEVRKKMENLVIRKESCCLRVNSRWSENRSLPNLMKDEQKMIYMSKWIGEKDQKSFHRKLLYFKIGMTVSQTNPWGKDLSKAVSHRSKIEPPSSEAVYTTCREQTTGKGLLSSCPACGFPQIHLAARGWQPDAWLNRPLVWPSRDFLCACKSRFERILCKLNFSSKVCTHIWLLLPANLHHAVLFQSSLRFLQFAMALLME